jgi:hypothetical protein
MLHFLSIYYSLPPSNSLYHSLINSIYVYIVLSLSISLSLTVPLNFEQRSFIKLEIGKIESDAFHLHKRMKPWRVLDWHMMTRVLRYFVHL